MPPIPDHLAPLPPRLTIKQVLSEVMKQIIVEHDALELRESAEWDAMQEGRNSVHPEELSGIAAGLCVALRIVENVFHELHDPSVPDDMTAGDVVALRNDNQRLRELCAEQSSALKWAREIMEQK